MSDLIAETLAKYADIDQLTVEHAMAAARLAYATGYMSALRGEPNECAADTEERPA